MFCACVLKLNEAAATPTFLHHMIARERKMTTGQVELKKELFSACRAGDVDRVRRAIAAGVDPKNAIKDWISIETPLHTACEYVINRRGSGWSPVKSQLVSCRACMFGASLSEGLCRTRVAVA